ncbi:MAG: signal peptidase II [Anaerolineales bacterium]|nr:signal peptidase II [Anaerolineales bacterium]
MPVVAILTLVIDQISKRVVMTSFRLGESWNPVAALERWVSLTYVTNTGAVFGLFPDHGIIFMVISVVVIVVIVLYYRHLPGDQWLIQTSLGLQLGGALGNLLDRLRYGHVIDFIDFKVWPVFNVADSSVFVGVVILAFHLLRDRGDWELEIRD